MFRKILVPVDGSEHSDKALLLAKELASKFDSEVLVFHVREKSVGRGGSWDVDLTEEEVDIAEEAAQALGLPITATDTRDSGHLAAAGAASSTKA